MGVFTYIYIALETKLASRLKWQGYSRIPEQMPSVPTAAVLPCRAFNLWLSQQCQSLMNPNAHYYEDARYRESPLQTGNHAQKSRTYHTIRAALIFWSVCASDRAFICVCVYTRCHLYYSNCYAQGFSLKRSTSNNRMKPYMVT